jgi:hypothetical protein
MTIVDAGLIPGVELHYETTATIMVTIRQLDPIYQQDTTSGIRTM